MRVNSVVLARMFRLEGFCRLGAGVTEEHELEVEGLCVSYGGVRALRDVSLRFDAGVSGILGPNGAGKTTLFRVLTGARRPRSGVVYWRGEAVSGTRRGYGLQARLGYLPQDPDWFEGFTARELCLYMAGLRAVPRRERADATVAALDAVGLGDKADERLSHLSGGQRRRAFIAQAMVHDPAVLILDEPTSGLDPVQRMQVRELIASLGESKTVILSTHLVEDVAKTARQIVVLDVGRVRWRGAPSELARLAGNQEAGSDSIGSRYERGFLQALGGSPS